MSMKPGQIKCPLRSTVVAACCSLNSVIVADCQSPAHQITPPIHITATSSSRTCCNDFAVCHQQAAVLKVLMRRGRGEEVAGYASGRRADEVKDRSTVSCRGGAGRWHRCDAAGKTQEGTAGEEGS